MHHDGAGLFRVQVTLPDLRSGGYASVDAPYGVLAYQRGERTLVALNLGTEPATLGGVTGAIRVATVRAHDDESVHGTLTLGPGEGAVVLLDVLPG